MASDLGQLRAAPAGLRQERREQGPPVAGPRSRQRRADDDRAGHRDRGARYAVLRTDGETFSLAPGDRDAIRIAARSGSRTARVSRRHAAGRVPDARGARSASIAVPWEASTVPGSTRTSFRTGGGSRISWSISDTAMPRRCGRGLRASISTRPAGSNNGPLRLEPGLQSTIRRRTRSRISASSACARGRSSGPRLPPA